ncbi:hypothetical protein vBBaMIFTN2_15 [Bordetella phage vB_BaM-IFTN2]|uniref:phage tail fiber protein n=3 Tax=Bordetella avium TaxID=521 RepID=UPI000E0B7686|nr:hypothetical protein [Bordetella avium]UOK17081.1 hypothetical protein vBBaMIFTN2_15 [Bordetella phage vB_BaM-IFTN2]UOK17144.1 hypothetical protein vBBaMIFTN3_15 [Bordetella phage vB_BaM-IFTN3]UOK17207.1 hypothetical protein vBBaMIFTN4_15 [Bordetella phage vB_BaM-IFTN4]UOK17279.1 hypothetical protein vBBaMIFTN5_15 [Bordetella phage vB_BaM-IFTN5]UOK17348.1 hypothetical protein vBBaMIFTN6_15 [Bordetella phage vB_BaM-IFTN6]
MHDVSAIGVALRCTASVSFPSGFTVTAFADDADPFDLPAIDIATPAMNVNGDLVVFSAPVPVTITLNVIPGSEDDENLAVIFDANRPGKNKRHAGDVITLVGTYPDGSTITLSEGKMTNGMPGSSPASAGRIKSKAYAFAFQNIARTRAASAA